MAHMDSFELIKSESIQIIHEHIERWKILFRALGFHGNEENVDKRHKLWLFGFSVFSSNVSQLTGWHFRQVLAKTVSFQPKVALVVFFETPPLKPSLPFKWLDEVCFVENIFQLCQVLFSAHKLGTNKRKIVFVRVQVSKSSMSYSFQKEFGC